MTMWHLLRLLMLFTEFSRHLSFMLKVGTQEKLRYRTARHRSKKSGFSWRKEVYVDGHERPDVRYRKEVFLPSSTEIRPLLVTWDEEGQMTMPQSVPPGQKPLVLTHDESAIDANDGK